LALVLFFPHYWEEGSSTGRQPTVQAAKPAASGATVGSLATGVTEDGHHWIGARTPQVVVEEFSDYQCPFCQRAHVHLRALVAEHPGSIRLIHRHLPLDHHCNPLITGTFHPRACYYAALSVCAGEQKKFWDANDYLYQHGRDPAPVTPKALEAELGVNSGRLEDCLKQRAWGGMRLDLEEAARLQLSATPTFRVDGQVYVGQVPPEVLAASIENGRSAGSG
jgi:protein-disulfide isomerase